jgi:hypothetical protein
MNDNVVGMDYSGMTALEQVLLDMLADVRSDKVTSLVILSAREQGGSAVVAITSPDDLMDLLDVAEKVARRLAGEYDELRGRYDN